MTYFDAGSKVQVFNSLWYPRYHLDAPVLGVDLMCFGNRAVLAVVDCQPLGGRSSSSNSGYLPAEGVGGAAVGIQTGTATSSSARSRSSSGSGTSSGSSLGENNPFEAVRAAYPTLQGKMSERYYDANQFFSDHMLYGRFEHPGAALAAQAAAATAAAVATDTAATTAAATTAAAPGVDMAAAETGKKSSSDDASAAAAAAPTAKRSPSSTVNWAPLLAEHPIQAELFPAFQQYCCAYLDLVAGVASSGADAPAAAVTSSSSSSSSSADTVVVLEEEKEEAFRRSREVAALEASVRAKQAAYDQYSANRDPAHALFQTYFGASFADQFMHEFLFAHSDPTVTAAYHAEAQKMKQRKSQQQQQAATSATSAAAAGTTLPAIASDGNSRSSPHAAALS